LLAPEILIPRKGSFFNPRQPAVATPFSRGNWPCFALGESKFRPYSLVFFAMLIHVDLRSTLRPSTGMASIPLHPRFAFGDVGVAPTFVWLEA